MRRFLFISLLLMTTLAGWSSWNFRNVAVVAAAKPKAAGGGGGGGATPTYRWSADSGVNQTAGSVNSWTDNVAGLVLTTSSNPNIDTGVQNGLPGIWFNSGNYLANKLPSPLTTGTVILVVKTTTTGAGNYAFAFDGTNATDRWVVYKGNNDKLSAGAATDISTSAAIANASKLIVEVRFNGASSSMWTNGVSAATGNTGTASLTGITIGTSYDKTFRWFNDAYIFDVLVFNTVLSDSDMTTWHTTLNSKWAIH